jgi:hypothetical protein
VTAEGTAAELLARLVTESDLRSLVARYAQLDDDGEGAALAELFAENGVLEAMGERHVGRAAVERFIRARVGLRTLRHAMTNQVIIAHSASVASGATDMVLLGRDPGGRWSVESTHRYLDDFVREQGRWLFAARRIRSW